MAGPRVTVLGSLNTDISVPVPHLPGPGETVLAAAAASIGTGGKGANQAVAAARLGAATRMVGCCGDDEFGGSLRGALAAEGIDVAGLRTAPGAASGLALRARTGAVRYARWARVQAASAREGSWRVRG